MAFSPARQLVQKYAAAFEAGSLEPLRDDLAATFIHEVYPSSLNIKRKGREEYLEWVAAAFSAFRDGKVTINPIETIESPLKIVLHLSTAQARMGTNEYMFIFTFVEEDGRTKIGHIKEFLDTAFFLGFMEALDSTSQF
ncbi:hypothetical protein EXIGLDRAFT_773276 [Exidia glandulosa HHB12029]|uniref:SnoaL-like domain-containing protein n=1 Tax=Exidia glandulosa HHB12029 TaxID=1314781 RepID=A0A165EVT6_EXIGL|nr:hypothetical protein EXIGLDRAFT_773276 [Exidia glandulosa HHB12029]